MKPPRRSKPAILFDLDGTLVDTVYQHVLAWSEALRTVGVLVPNWEIHRRIGMNGRSLLRQLLRQYGKGTSTINLQDLEKLHDTAFNKTIREVVPLPGAARLLRHLNRIGLRWAIATAGSRAQTNRLLGKLGVSAKTIVTGDDIANAKPAPDIFLAAAMRLSAPIEDCIVVGDSVWDMLAAERSKALSVGILGGGYSTEELALAGALRVYADPAAMLEHIEDIGIS